MSSTVEINPFVGLGDFIQSTDYHIWPEGDRIAVDAGLSFADMAVGNPELARLATPESQRNAHNAIKGLGSHLVDDATIFSHLEKRLRNRQNTIPGKKALFVGKRAPLVMYTGSRGLEGFAPVLTTTLKAVEDLRASFIDKNIGLAIVDEEILRPKAAGNRQVPYTFYNSRDTKPADFVATAARFTMETFRFRIEDGRLIRKILR